MRGSRGRPSVTSELISSRRKIYAPYKLTALVEVAGEAGITSTDVLAGTGLEAVELADPYTRTSVEQYLQACNNVLRLNDDPELPFNVGERLHLSAYGIYGFVLLCSPTVREGLTLAMRFHPLATPIFSIAWRETRDAFVWSFPNEFSLAVTPSLERFLMAQQLAQHLTHVRDIARTDRVPMRIGIAHSPPCNPSIYERRLLCPITFDAAKTEIIYDRNILDDRPPLKNRTTLAMLLESCERLVGARETPGGLAGNVAHILMERSGAFPGMAEVANELGMTPRTLRRRLAEEGQVFSQIFDDVRRKLALRYLASSKFTVADIADLLSFDDVSNFRRAFRRWTGKPPTAFRKAPQDIMLDAAELDHSSP